jgi:VWFA-related protein
VRQRFGALSAASAALAAALVIAPARPRAQQTPPPPTPPATAPAPQAPPQQPIRVETNFVRVDVYPTEDGQIVPDLGAEDFEILEDGVAQSVKAFEFIVIRAGGPQSARVEPNTVAQAEQMAANPRNRVFVVFLDVGHVTVAGSHNIQGPLIRLLDRTLGADDLVAVMTPDMSPNQLAFGRKTEILARGLNENWPWGERHRINPMDKTEKDYEDCYTPYQDAGPPDDAVALIEKMKDRRRERLTLDAFRDLVIYLGNLREERKAILTVTEGWVLYRPDHTMTNLLRVLDQTESVPGVPRIGVDGVGKLGTDNSRKYSDASKTKCDADRISLATIDNDQYFKDILDFANRANASFYPIDPRGLAVWDNPMGPRVPPSPLADQAMLRKRLDTMQVLASNTDGLAVINSNDIDRGLRRVADDLTSYYLLGYYSTNTKLDGRFRSIKVRVKRPGVAVRARRGYRAATQEEVTAAREAAAASVPEPTSSVKAAIASLSRIRTDGRLNLHAVVVRGGLSGAAGAIWVEGELPADPRWTSGASIDLELAGSGTSATKQVTLNPRERSFVIALPLQSLDAPVDIRAKATPAGGTATPLTEVLKLDVPSTGPQALLYRRGPSTGNRLRPAADARFSRTERLRLELPVSSAAKPVGAKLLDRAGTAIELPVTLGERTDEGTGQRFITADLTLAPLGGGDFVVEMIVNDGNREERVVTAVRVTR